MYRIEKKAVPVTFVSMISGLTPPTIPGTWTVAIKDVVS